MPLSDADIDCREGRQIVFIDLNAARDLDLDADMSRALLPVLRSARTV